jgi:hypothetical protein
MLESPYVGQISEHNQRIIEQLTASKNWDFQQFTRVMVALSTIDQYMPGRRAPQSIHIQGFRKKLDRLYELSDEAGLEHAQPILTDIDTRKFVYGRITRGSKHRVRLDSKKQEGREHLQKRILSMHIHPKGEGIGNGLGLSNADFTTLLSDSEQIGMMMRVIDTIFLVLKTNVTPNNLNKSAVERMIQQANKDYLVDSKKVDILRLVDFNRAVCMESGMVLFMATKQSRDLMERVKVAVE